MQYTPFLEGSLEGGDLRVGTRAEDGWTVQAEIYCDDSWVHIVTDDYEGHAMLKLEALPLLRQALDMVAKRVEEPTP